MGKLTAYGPSLVVLATASMVLLVGPSAVRRLTYTQTEARMIQATNRLENNNVLAEFNQAIEDIADFVEPSVVHISAQQSEPERGGILALSSGSGWVYDVEGHIVTNYHVIKDADRIEVQLSSGQLRPAEVVGYDSSTDIAVLAIASNNLHPAVLAEPDHSVNQGDLVFAFGSPFDFKFSMSSGIVSGKGRSVDALPQGGYENFIQVDAAINPGNSGGPLTDYQGRVVGMNTAIATGRRNSLEEGQFAGIGLAIPLSMIKPVVTQIIETGVVEKGWLGVGVDELDRELKAQLRLSAEGVLINSVDTGSPAEAADVRVGDIVTSVDGQSVSSVAQLRSTISSMLPGETTVLEVIRPDLASGMIENITIPVKLARLDPIRARGELPSNQPRDRIVQLGLARILTSTSEEAARLGIAHHDGVIVERVVPGSDLARYMRDGTIITEVMGRPVASVDDFLEQLRGWNLRGGVRVAVVTPEGKKGLVNLFVLQ